MADDDYPTDSKSYKILKKIGAGDNTVVIKAVCTRMNSCALAIKIMESIPNPEDVRRESEAMKDLSVRTVTRSLPHPNILQPHCSFTVRSRRWVVMPFMSGGSLLSIIASSHPNGLPEPIMAAVLKGVLLALLHLHNHSRLHMNIKAGNILVDSNGSVKLGDCWASSSILDFNMWSADVDVEKAYWVAPEVIHSRVGHTFKADIWGFGVAALELAYGRPPLSHLPRSKTMKIEITKRFRSCDPYNKTKASDNNREFTVSFKNMVGLCLNHDRYWRPTADLIKNFLKGIDTKLKSSIIESKNEYCDVEVENVKWVSG